MGFCTYCGKQLADGEVCDCEQSRQARSAQNSQQTQNYGQQAQNFNYGSQPQQTGKMEKEIKGGAASVVTYVKSYVKDPIAATEEFYQKKSLSASAILIVASAAAYILATLLNLVTRIVYTLVAGKELIEDWGYGRWEVLNDAGIHVWSFVQSVFFPIIYVVLMTATIVGLAVLIQTVILKEKSDLNKALSFAGTFSVPFAAMVLVSIFRHIIHVEAFNDYIFPLIINCIGALAVVQAVVCLGHEIRDNKKLALSSVIFAAGITTVDYLLWIVIMKYCVSYFSVI